MLLSEVPFDYMYRLRHMDLCCSIPEIWYSFLHLSREAEQRDWRRLRKMEQQIENEQTEFHLATVLFLSEKTHDHRGNQIAY